MHCKPDPEALRLRTARNWLTLIDTLFRAESAIRPSSWVAAAVGCLQRHEPSPAAAAGAGQCAGGLPGQRPSAACPGETLPLTAAALHSAAAAHSRHCSEPVYHIGCQAYR